MKRVTTLLAALAFSALLTANSHAADTVLRIDPMNPQVAARLLRHLSRWRRYDEGRRGEMAAQLQRILEQPGMSADTFEVATRCLAPE